MKHDFTIDQISPAIRKAAVKRGSEVILDLSANDVRAILDALPDPAPVADEWEECKSDEIQSGERFLVKLDGWTFEGRRSRSHDLVIKLPGVDKYIDTSFIAQLAGNTKTGRARFYRIPAPVQHPDPEQHKVILVTEYDVAGNVMDCEPTPFFAHDGVYKNDVYTHRPDDVLTWSPAKIAPAGDV